MYKISIFNVKRVSVWWKTWIFQLEKRGWWSVDIYSNFSFPFITHSRSSSSKDRRESGEERREGAIKVKLVWYSKTLMLTAIPALPSSQHRTNSQLSAKLESETWMKVIDYFLMWIFDTLPPPTSIDSIFDEKLRDRERKFYVNSKIFKAYHPRLKEKYWLIVSSPLYLTTELELSNNVAAYWIQAFFLLFSLPIIQYISRTTLAQIEFEVGKFKFMRNQSIQHRFNEIQPSKE